MPQNVQRPLAGYLDLLRIVGQQPPSRILDDIRATVDVTSFLKGGTIVTAAGNTVASSAPGDLSAATVPQGVVWIPFVLQSVFSATTVGDQVKTSVGIGVPGSSVRIASSEVQTSLSTTARLGFGFQLPDVIILRPGNTCFSVVDDVSLAAGTRTLNISVLAYELRI